MRFWYVSKRSENVFDHASMILFVAVLIAVLTWLFPQQSVFRKHLRPSEIDAVSIAYLELLLRNAPDDTSLRLNLVDQLLHTGQARKALSNLLLIDADQEPSLRAKTDIMRLRVFSQMVFADSEKSESYKSQLLALLDGLSKTPVEEEDKLLMARVSLSIGSPRRAADYYADLALQWPKKYFIYAEKAAELYVQSEELDEAAEWYTKLFRRSYRVDKKRYLDLAINIFLMRSNHNKALDLYESYLANFPQSVVAIEEAVRLAIAVGERKTAAKYLGQLYALSKTNKKRLYTIQTKALAIGENKLSILAGETYLKLDRSNWAQRIKLAQVLEWSGKPERALHHWRQIGKALPNMQSQKAILRLAGGLFSFDAIIDLYEAQARRRQLSSSEMDKLVSAYEKEGLPEEGIDYLNTYIDRYPNDRNAWLGVAYLFERDTDINSAIRVWGSIAQRFGLEASDAQKVASLMWMQDDVDSALAVLKKHAGGAREEDRDFWRMMASLAWAAGDDKLAYDVVRKLARNEEELTTAEVDILLLVDDAENRELQLRIASSSWARFKQPYHLLAKMQLLSNMKKWDELASTMREADKEIQLFKDNAHYWSIKAGYHFAQTEHAEARASYLKALQLSGNAASNIQSLLWFLVNTRSKQDLNHYLAMWAPLAEEQTELWPVFAAATTVQGDYANALVWYKRLIENNPKDFNALLAYADTLQMAGYSNAAWKLRRYMLKRVQEYQAKGPAEVELKTAEWFGEVGEADNIRLVDAVYSYKDANAMVKAEKSNMPNTVWLPILTEHLVANGKMEAAIYWGNLSDLAVQRDASLFEKFALADRSYDNDDMQSLLVRRRELMPSMEAHLLYRLGYQSHALAVRLNGLVGEYSDIEESGLRKSAAQQVAGRPSGLRLDYQLDSFGSVSLSGPRVTLAQYFDNWHFQGELATVTYEQSDSPAFQQLSAEQVLNTRLIRDTRRGSMTGEAWLSKRDDSSLAGLSMAYQRNWGSNLSSTVSASWRDLPEFTAYMRGFAAYDHLDLSVQHKITARDQVSYELALHDFTARASKEKFASGYKAAINYLHAVNFEDPEAFIGLGVETIQTRYSGTLPNDLSQALSLGGESRDALMPEEYGQVFLGATLRHGELHAINARVPTPRYLLNTSVSYQWPTDTVGFNGTAGLGWRVFGNDELALSYRYNSAPIGSQGDASQDFRLSYSYRFGK